MGTPPAAGEPAAGILRIPLPLGIHGIPSVNGWLLQDDQAGATLVDCGIYAGTEEDGGTGALREQLAVYGLRVEDIRRLVVTHAHIDHYGLAGEIVRRTGADLWMHVRADADIAKYRNPEGAVDRRREMLNEHGLYGEELTRASSGLRDWMPVMPSIAEATTRLRGGETFAAGGRNWEIVHTPGHSPGHVCLWSETDRLLLSGDHLLPGISPPVTFERGFEADPLGSYLASLTRVEEIAPALVLPGHGEPFADGARRAQAIAQAKQRRLAKALQILDDGPITVTDLTRRLVGRDLDGARLHFAMAESLAYLAYYDVRGVAYRVPGADGVFVWRATASA
jgi:glyoxylase-like metal-dependent hydrolase (beta-lactamase superfamily II)